jgi:hypothetical protein
MNGGHRVATVRFGSGSGTFWPNPNPNLGSGSGFEPGSDWTYFLFWKFSGHKWTPSSLRPSLEVRVRNFPEPEP